MEVRGSVAEAASVRLRNDLCKVQMAAYTMAYRRHFAFVGCPLV